jgi:hypothetical protein
MAVSPEDLAAGTLAFQTFVANAKYVEMIVDVAFAVVPSILGIGAASLIGHGVISTAREVRNSISLIRAMGPAMRYGGALGVITGKGVNKGRNWVGERLKQYNHPVPQFVGHFLTLDQLIKSKWTKRKQNNQDTQGKQEGQGKIISFEEVLKRQQQDGGGGDKRPPSPPAA